MPKSIYHAKGEALLLIGLTLGSPCYAPINVCGEDGQTLGVLTQKSVRIPTMVHCENSLYSHG